MYALAKGQKPETCNSTPHDSAIDYIIRNSDGWASMNGDHVLTARYILTPERNLMDALLSMRIHACLHDSNVHLARIGTFLINRGGVSCELFISEKLYENTFVSKATVAPGRLSIE